MRVERGEVFGFLGPNGAGKTTAIKLLLGLAHPTAGEGTVLGAPLGDTRIRRRVGYLPELFRYQEWLTAREVLGLHSALIGIARDRRRRPIDDALQLVGLSERADSRVGGFSKGMQQRLGLAVALLGRPDLVLLDEPTSALDPVGRHDVREIIRALRARGATVLLNSHLLTEVEQVCDRVAVVDGGHVIAVSTMAELTAQTHSVRIRCAQLASAVEAPLAAYGSVIWVDGWYQVQDISPAAVPDLVSTLVGLGARIQAVEPGRPTLEQRFLEILKGSRDAGTGDRPAHSV
jgi:ABC-2 type transport system ATP-binding protein